jgi:PAS domain S-box-containing protein
MLAIPAFAYSQGDTYHKTNSAALFCWDVANPVLERRIQIHNDIQQFESLILANDWQLEIDYKSSLIENCTLIVTNLSREIIWASKAFQTMTGYQVDEVLGKTPSFLQGEKTNPKARQIIKDRLANFESFQARIVNYRKSGESYWCGLSIFPVKNSTGQVTHFLAIEKEVN